MNNNPLLELFLDWLYPKQCVHCHHVGNYLCNFCFERLEFLPLPIELNNLETQYLDQAFSLAVYQEPISTLIQTLKYQSVKGIAKLFAQMLWNSAAFPLSPNTYFCPVPIHQKRYFERGFNQAEEIALALAQKSQLPMLKLLVKQVNTKHQAASKNKAQRLEQLKDSFGLDQKIFAQILQAQHSSVILVDDVITTGATMNECAKILKQNGVKQVFGLAIAHEN